MFKMISDHLSSGVLLYPSILVLLVIFAYQFYRLFRNVRQKRRKAREADFYKLLGDAGYSYDPAQDIVYSKMNAWQREFGYCRLYDEAAAPAGMVLDTDPIYFAYGGKRWMIQLWKGQYLVNTGCEIGVYYTDDSDVTVPNLFSGAFYKCVSNKDRLKMTYKLYKNGQELFHREDKHWWLTGFKIGEFSEPRELSMQISITFRHKSMCGSFLKAMKKIGYSEQEIKTDGITAEFLFDKTRTPQPKTRSEETDWIIQRGNEFMCKKFHELTGNRPDLKDKLNLVREKEPQLYQALINIGKTRQVFKAFEKLKGYIN
jgi:hypothetical protein